MAGLTVETLAREMAEMLVGVSVLVKVERLVDALDVLTADL